MRRAALGVMTMTVLALAACGGGAGGSDLPAGQHDLGHGVSVAVRQVMDPMSPDRAYEKRYGIDADPEPGTRFVAVDFEYFNHNDGAATLTGLGFGATMQTTSHHEADRNLNPPTDRLPTVPSAIPPHSSVRGWEIYEVPNGDKPVTLLLRRLADDGYDLFGDPVAINL